MFLTKLKSATAALLVCMIGVGALALTAFHASGADRPRLLAITARDGPAPDKGAQPAKPKVPQGPFVVGETDTLFALAFDPDSKVVAGGGGDKKVRVWDLREHKVKQTLEGAKGIIRSVKVSPDGKTLVAGADDGGLYIWNLATGKLETELHAELPKRPKMGEGDLFGGQVCINGLTFLPEGKLAAAYNYQHKTSGDYYSRIVVWDVRGKSPEMLFEQVGPCYSLALSPDGTRLAATLQGGFNGFKVWDLKRRDVVWEEEARNDFMTTVLWSPDGKQLALGGGHSVQTNEGFRAEGRIWLFDVKARKQLWYGKEPDNWTYSRIAFTADGKGLVTGSSGNGGCEFRRWDPATGKVVWTTRGGGGDCHGIAVSADGKTVAGNDDTQLMLFDAETGAMKKVLAKVRR